MPWRRILTASVLSVRITVGYHGSSIPRIRTELFTSCGQGDDRQATAVVPERREKTGERYEDRDSGHPRAYAAAFHQVPEAEEEDERDRDSTGDPFFTVCGRDLRRPPEERGDNDKRIHREQEEPYPHRSPVRHTGTAEIVLDACE